jgi:lysophospholipase L1-like esterase
MTIDEDAALHLHRDPFSPSMRPLTVSQGWRWGVSDEEGHLTAAVDDRGSFQVFRGAGAKTAILGQVACIGDSLTNGYSGGSTWPAAQSWPMQMAANRPDLTVTKLGFNGNTTDEVRLRVGALPLMISGATGNTIPSTGTVNVTTRQQVGWGTANVAVAGTIAGIGGTLTHDGSTLTFTRNGQGDPYTITAPVRFVPNVDDYSSHNVVLWVGRNDINSGVTGAEASTAEHVVAGVLETVEWLAPRTKSIVVVSAINQNKEPRGHERYQVVQDINAGLKAALPHKFLDIRSYLVNQAIYDAGLTPTATDLQNIADDCPPAQIWDDGSHYLPIVAPHVAAFIQTRLEAKGLI